MMFRVFRVRTTRVVLDRMNQDSIYEKAVFSLFNERPVERQQEEGVWMIW